MTTTWKDELKNLGIDSDLEIAERLGVTKERVRQKRRQLNIPRAPRQMKRPTREGRKNDIAELLPIVPLSVSDRQLLTDARVARGWSQTELAKRAGGSLTFINGSKWEKIAVSRVLQQVV